MKLCMHLHIRPLQFNIKVTVYASILIVPNLATQTYKCLDLLMIGNMIDCIWVT